jgi:hypothetical protein
VACQFLESSGRVIVCCFGFRGAVKHFLPCRNGFLRPPLILDTLRKKIKKYRVVNTPAKIHGVKYTGNTPSPEIHPKIHPPGWEIHAVYFFSPAAQSPQSGMLLWWFSLVVFNAA